MRGVRHARSVEQAAVIFAADTTPAPQCGSKVLRLRNLERLELLSLTFKRRR